MIIDVSSNQSDLSSVYKDGCAYGIAYWADCNERTMELFADTFTCIDHAQEAVNNENPEDYVNGQLLIVQLHVGDIAKVV